MKHIKVLEDSGLIASEKVGRVCSCRLKPKRLAVTEDWLSEHRKLWEGRADRLAEYVETLASEEKASE